jgi:hypothetical protein
LGNNWTNGCQLISSRAESTKENMGLTTWKNPPKGKIRKTGVGIAKNYLNEKELDVIKPNCNYVFRFCRIAGEQRNRDVYERLDKKVRCIFAI